MRGIATLLVVLTALFLPVGPSERTVREVPYVPSVSNLRS